MSKNPKRVGLIAEDESDIESLKELLKKITGKSNISFRHFVGRGCGKIKRKAKDWAKELESKGCKVLILVHDLDKNKYDDLYKQIDCSLHPYVINETLINIPIEEMESWLLADEEAIKKALKLKKITKVYHKPESVTSPKEVLAKEIEKASDKTKIYLNTKHNALIAKSLNIDCVKKKCKSFEALCDFALENI